jgi:enoyl-CoA hydratase/carnithine racemase
VTVHYTREGPVAWLTIDRPESRNALSAEVRAGLWDGVRRFVADDAAVLVLTGAGDRAFCAGGDLKEMADAALEVPPPDFLPQFGRNVDVPKPTIAAVNGVAYAGGFLLAQQCDLVVAAEHAAFAVTEVRVGRGAPWAAPLPWLVGPRAAADNAPLSVAAAKRTVYLSAPAAEADAIWAPVYRSADAQEGPRAFREKRTPVWKGR